MNRVGQVIQMDGYGTTTCLIVERRNLRDEWPDLWNWILIVIDYEPPSYQQGPDAHLVGSELHLNNQYVKQYSRPVT